MNRSESELLNNGLGNVTWWGYSPAKNLLEDAKSFGCDDLKALIVGSGDGRHLLKTLAESNTERNIEFFALEQNLMTYARQCLFLSLAQDPDISSATQAAEIFMDLFGNIQIRRKSSEYLRKIASKFTKTLADLPSKDDSMDHDLHTPLIELNFKELKIKEIDTLASIFKLWTGHCKEPLDMNNAWNSRIRHLLAERIESKEGVFDMDYHFRLVPRGGAGISIKEYRAWRSSGNAFHLRDDPDGSEDVLETNNSIVSSLIVTSRDGKKGISRGYWGDIVTGPFISFGFQASNQVKLEEGKLHCFSYEQTKSSLIEIIDKIRGKMESSGRIRDRLTFLPLTADKHLTNETTPKFGGPYGVAFVGCSMAHILQPEMFVKLGPNSVLYLETPLYLLHIADEVQEKFKTHLLESGVQSNGFSLEGFDQEQSSILFLSKSS